jgi:hypothetical protein
VADSAVCTSHEDKSRAVDDFYIKLLGTTTDRAHSIDLQALGMHSHDLADLDAPFSEKEVWEIIKQLSSDKAPGLDGFMGGGGLQNMLSNNKTRHDDGCFGCLE